MLLGRQAGNCEAMISAPRTRRHFLPATGPLGPGCWPAPGALRCIDRRHSACVRCPVTSRPTFAEIDALLSGATPQFALQLHARALLLCDLPEDDRTRQYGLEKMRMLEQLAMGTTRAPSTSIAPEPGDAGWRSIPSHPGTTGRTG